MITKEQAIEIARLRAEENGRSFDGGEIQVLNQTRLFKKEIVSYEVMLNATLRGPDWCSIVVDAKTGEILEEKYRPPLGFKFSQ